MRKVFVSIVCFILAIMCVTISEKEGIVLANYAYNMFENFTSKSYVLLEANSGKVLVSKNENEKMQVASICKLMTSLITLEKLESGALKLEDELVASEHACSMEGSQAFLDAGSSYTVANLLKSVVVASANDSAVVLAESISGSESAFVELMNKRAKELGMHSTVYANATGLPAPNQYSTAMDTSLILKEISKYDLYVEYSNIWMDKFVHPSGRETELVNTNRLIKYYDKCKTGKTGFTDEAGYCLASSASNGNLDLIAVALKCDKAQDRFKESMDLFNYGFANFENVKIVDKTEKLDDVPVFGGKKSTAIIEYNNDFYVVTNKGDKTEYVVNIEVFDKVKAPAQKGTKVGVATILSSGRIVGEVDIVLSENVEKHDFVDIVTKIAKNWELVG